MNGRGVLRRVLALCSLALCILTSVARAESVYRQPTLYEWDRLTIDILVLPPSHGQVYNDGGVLPKGAQDLRPGQNSYLRAIESGIGLWREAVRNHAPGWLSDKLSIRSYVLGRDHVPDQVMANLEIVVTTVETMGPVLGTSYPSRPCPAVVAQEFHVSLTEADVTNIAAHEVGHCLGLAHIDGPLPRQDLMQGVYQHPDGLQSTPVNCPSTLNVAGLVKVFARAAGQPGGGGTAQIAPSDYVRAC